MNGRDVSSAADHTGGGRSVCGRERKGSSEGSARANNTLCERGGGAGERVRDNTWGGDKRGREN